MSTARHDPMRPIRLVVALSAGIMLAMLFARAAAAQPTPPAPSGASARYDSLARELEELRAHARRVDSLVARDSIANARARAALDSAQRVEDLARLAQEVQLAALRPSLWFAGTMGLAVAANGIWQLDRDAGGYEDTYWSDDKLTHLSIAQTLTASAMNLGVRPWTAAAITCAGGAAYEFSQAQGGGYVSNRDMVANCTGAVLAVGWRKASRYFARRATEGQR